MNNEILPNDYRETLNLIIQKIQLAQQKAVISANITLLDLYWEGYSSINLKYMS